VPFNSLLHVLPGSPLRLSRQDSPGSSLDLRGPGLLELLRVVGQLLVQAGKQLRSDIGSLARGELQGFLEDRLACHGL
jgi:hypothetical protein